MPIIIIIFIFIIIDGILFVLEKVTDATFEEVMKSVIPFYLPVLNVLLLIVLFPDLVTYIPLEFLG